MDLDNALAAKGKEVAEATAAIMHQAEQLEFFRRQADGMTAVRAALAAMAGIDDMPLVKVNVAVAEIWRVVSAGGLTAGNAFLMAFPHRIIPFVRRCAGRRWRHQRPECGWCVRVCRRQDGAGCLRAASRA